MMKSLILLLAGSAMIPAVASAQDAMPAPATTAVVATQGKMLYAVGGARVAPIYRVAADGSPQVILEGKLITVPRSSLSEADGKVMTSLSRKDLRSSH